MRGHVSVIGREEVFFERGEDGRRLGGRVLEQIIGASLAPGDVAQSSLAKRPPPGGDILGPIRRGPGEAARTFRTCGEIEEPGVGGIEADGIGPVARVAADAMQEHDDRRIRATRRGDEIREGMFGGAVLLKIDQQAREGGLIHYPAPFQSVGVGTGPASAWHVAGLQGG